MGQLLMAAGAAKNPKASISFSPAGVNYNAELWLGPNASTRTATSGLKAATSAGVAQDVPLPITLPSAPGIYQVFVDVLYGGILLDSRQGTDDVVIANATMTTITLPGVAAPGSAIPISAPVTVVPSGIAFTLEVYLTSTGSTTKVATIGVKTATSTGSAQTITGTMVAPSSAGTYKSYIDVLVGGLLFQFTSTDVVVPGVVIGPITW